ncbi:hypothetical protein RUM43_012078 [Polyplax serrata]|uniref:dihydrofolate reductase n=1 Tax=Polyplax serrata TaxID=468196 RepID=A0AAN8S4C0_POLSC
MGIPCNMIAAMCSNNGIGYKGNLPWKLKKELEYFARITKEVSNPKMKNAVIMGRKTWDSLPRNWKPLPGRYNFVLSRHAIDLPGAILCSSLDNVIQKINSPEFTNKIETAWLIGGSQIYEAALNRNMCDRVYLTRILKEFECDCFINFDFSKGYKEISDERVPKEVQEEDEVKFVFYVYEKIQ